MSSAFTYSGAAHPCPVCGRTKDGDCRLRNDGLVHCHTHRGDGLGHGAAAPSGAPFKFVSTSDEAQGFGIWKPADQWVERSNSTPNPRSHREPSSVAGAITLTAKLTRPKGQTTFSFSRWDGTPVKAVKHRIDHGDGRGKKVTWRPALFKEGLTQADLAPWNWHDAIAAHQQNDRPIVVVKGELKASWLKALEIPAVSINEWNHATAEHLLALGDAIVLAPDCDLADLQGWYAKAKAALPQARHLLTPGANWLDPPGKDGVGVDDWLQSNLESVTPNTASDLLASINGQPWQPQADGERSAPDVREALGYNQLLDAVLEAIRGDADDMEMLARAELKIRFRLSDEQISAGLWRRYGKQKASAQPMTADSVDLSRVAPLGYRMDGWIPLGDLSMLYGPYGTGKTTLAIWKAYHLAKGVNVLDRSEPCKPGRSLFVATDSGAAALKKSLYDIGIDPDIDPLFRPGHPEQAIWIWAHEPDQGHEAWVCDIRGIIRLEAFIQKHQIAYCAIDSAKSVSASAGWSYTSNESVKAVLKVIREGLCQPLGCCIEFISHDGSEKGTHSGARAWAEDPSMVCSLTLVKGAEGRPDSVAVEFKKDRSAVTDPRRRLTYTLSEESLVVTSGETVGTCRDAILDVMWTAYRKGREVLTLQGIQDEVFARHGRSRKTVENTIGRLVGSGAGPAPAPLIKAGRGRYKLTPREIQAREAPLLAHDQDVAASSAQLDGETSSFPNRGVGFKGGVIGKSIPAQSVCNPPIKPPDLGSGGFDSPRQSPEGETVGGSISSVMPVHLAATPPAKQGLPEDLADSSADQQPATVLVAEPEVAAIPLTGASAFPENSAVTSPAHLAANASRSNLTTFQPGDRVYIAHQRLAPGRLHPAEVTRVINAGIHFDPPLERLLKDPEAPDAGAWIPPHPITSISTANCFHELGTTAEVRIENVECDGETWSRLIWQHPDGTTTTREILPASVHSHALTDDELEDLLQEIHEGGE